MDANPGKGEIMRKKITTSHLIETGRIRVDLGTEIVEVDGEPVRLTDKEYQILKLLSLHKGTTVTKEMILTHLYDDRSRPKPKIIDVFICYLRKKLSGATGGDHYIETIWGRGYRLNLPDTRAVE